MSVQCLDDHLGSDKYRKGLGMQSICAFWTTPQFNSETSMRVGMPFMFWRRREVVKRFEKGSLQHLNRGTVNDDTTKASIVRQQENHRRWAGMESHLDELGNLLIEGLNRIELDPTFREKVQKRTH